MPATRRDFLCGFLTGLCWIQGQGCSRQGSIDRIAVGGTVRVNGEPVQAGRVALLPIDGKTGPASGGRIQNGVFQIARADGPVPGEYRVEILAFQPTGKKILDPEVQGASGKAVEEFVQILPEKFNRESELTTKIEPSTAKELNFDLEVPPSDLPASL